MSNNFEASQFPDLLRNCVLHYTGEHVSINVSNISHNRSYSGNYTIDVFTIISNTTSSLIWTAPAGISSVEYLVVGGGGGGAYGGGGAGGLLTGTLNVSSGQSYGITIGAGGASATNGSNSIFSTITAYGGGKGGVSWSTIDTVGDGGSGGGGGYQYSGANADGGLGNTPSTSPSQGNNGGNGTVIGSGNTYGGGGGGAGSAGSSQTGGIGVSSSITGSAIYYAGGGGGGGQSSVGGLGGLGGGGSGYNSSNGRLSGTNGLGGGGGGGNVSDSVGASGGSGTVILRYLTPAGMNLSVILRDYDCFPIIPSGVTVTNNGTFTKDDLGNNKQVVKFDGSTNYMLVTNSVTNFGTSDWAICVWFKSLGISGNHAFIFGNSYYPSIATGMYGLKIKTASNIISFFYRNGAIDVNVDTSFNPSDGNWHHIVANRVGTSFTIYVDGALQTTATLPSSFDFTNTTYSGQIGTSRDASSYICGMLKDLIVYKGRALTVPEIKLLMNRTHPITGAGLMPANGDYWRIS